MTLSDIIFTIYLFSKAGLMSRTLGNIFYGIFEKPFLREYQYSRSMNLKVMTNVYTHAHRVGEGYYRVITRKKNNQISQFYCPIFKGALNTRDERGK